MEFDEVATTRRSVHQYSDEELPEATLRETFEAVRHAPSSYDLQPWEFLVVRGDDLERLQAAAYGQEHVTDAAAAVVVLGNLDPSAHVDRVVRDQVEKGYLPNEDAAEAVRETVESMAEGEYERRRNWTTTSTALAAMSLMHAAWSRGVASCPMGGFDEDAVRDAFDVPEGYEPVMLVTLGYPAEDAPDIERPRKFRRPVDEFVHFDEFEPRAERPAPADD